MKIKQIELIMSAGFVSQCPPDSLPDIAFAGRSNVGKSSLLNAMFQRRSLARTSSTPGKTQTLNFYRINDCFNMVDLPGYGYAALGKGKQQTISLLLQDYLLKRQQLQLLVQLVDSRHEPSELDKEMTAFLQRCNIPFIVVATKRDKLTRSQWQSKASMLKRALLLPEPPLLFTIEEEQSREALWSILEKLVPQILQQQEEQV